MLKIASICAIAGLAFALVQWSEPPSIADCTGDNCGKDVDNGGRNPTPPKKGEIFTVADCTGDDCGKEVNNGGRSSKFADGVA